MSDADVSTPVTPADAPPKIGPVRMIIRGVIVVGVLALGMMVMVSLIKSKPQAKRAPEADTSPFVTAEPVHATTQKVEVEASGTVQAARQVLIGAEVAGRVTWINSNLEPGARVKAGTALLKVDARDYQLAVEQQAAQVSLAASQLEVEKSRRRVAEKEWEAFGEKPPEGSVAARDPQIKAAEGAVKAADSGLRRAKLAVSKAGIVAPFNAMVVSRDVDLGQQVGPGSPLAVLVGTDAFWVKVAVPMQRLSWIDIPGVRGVADDAGSVVTIEQHLGTQTIARHGRVIRLVGAVDAVGRMAQLLIEIRDPLGVTDALREGDPGLPLLLNSYVDVRIAGHQLDDVVEVPRLALRGDDTVWVVDGDHLTFVTVDVVWRRRDSVLVRGVADGAEVVTSPVPGPVDGMKVRRAGAAAPAAPVATDGGAAPALDATAGAPAAAGANAGTGAN